MFASFFVALLVVTTTIGHVQMATMQFEDCGNGEVERITIEPCATLPCHFSQGQQANVSITFVAKQSAELVKVKSTLRRGGIFNYELEVPEVDPNVCRNGSSLTDWGKVDCPIESTKRYTFVYSRPFPVSTSYNIFRYSKLRFISSDNRLIACADMRLQFNRASSNIEHDNDSGRDDAQLVLH